MCLGAYGRVEVGCPEVWRCSYEGGRRICVGFPSEGVPTGGWRYSCEERIRIDAYGSVGGKNVVCGC